MPASWKEHLAGTRHHHAHICVKECLCRAQPAARPRPATAGVSEEQEGECLTAAWPVGPQAALHRTHVVLGLRDIARADLLNCSQQLQ